MSMRSWSVDGYGVEMTDIVKSVSAEKWAELISLAPTLQEKVQNYFDKHDYKSPYSYGDYIDYCCDNNEEDYLSWLIADVIREKEYINLIVDADEDGNEYLLLESKLPWEVDTVSEQSLTPEKLERIISKYVGIISDRKIELDYVSIEHFG